MKARLVKYQKDAAKLKRLMREAAELVLAQEELTWGMFKIGQVELCSYFRQRDLCHQVPWGQGYRTIKTCLLLLNESRLTRQRQNTTWKLLFSTCLNHLCTESFVPVGVLSEHLSALRTRALLHCTRRLDGCISPAVELRYSAGAGTADTAHTELPSPSHTRPQRGSAAATDPHCHQWQMLPAQPALRSQRGVVATTQPPFWLPASRIPALQQHLHVVYISTQIFRLWFVTLRMTPRCSGWKSKARAWENEQNSSRPFQNNDNALGHS